ncbi:MAG: helix-turn-helix domain-containing protein [Rubrivivax sp.]|nr:helix-turn-helix domain-containing protein [Rubrivivax sp.]
MRRRAPVRTEAALSVALLAVPQTTPAALYGLWEVFAAVGVAWGRLTGEQAPARRIQARVVASRREPFTASLGVPIVPASSLASAAASDLVIVSDLSLAPHEDARGLWPAEASWLRARFERGAAVASVCTGSVLLAEAGLLDGWPATTHWAARSIFERCYPQVDLRPERILCPAGPEQRIVTSGGSAAWADLALYVIARYCGQPEAQRIAKIFVLGDHSDGQLPFATMTGHRYHEDGLIHRCQAWAADHYASRNPVAEMMARARLPARTFARRFAKATGYTPLGYVHALRVEEAKQMLETSDAPVEQIAHEVGYGDPAFFRRLFKRRTGITPARYRQRFGRVGWVEQR